MKQYIVDSCGVKRSADFVGCTSCSKQFLKSLKNIKTTKSKQHFCSQICFQDFKKRLNIHTKCAWCGLAIERRGSRSKTTKSNLHFCSVLCKNKAQSINGLSAITPSHYGTSKKGHVCKICGVATYQTFYCSDHKINFKYEEYIEKWILGQVSGNGSNNEYLSSHVRRYMFEKYDSKCQKCGWAKIHPTTGKIPLTVNHIDGDCTNSKEENLELICPNCHSLTPNYGALNKGSGRTSRKEKKRDEKFLNGKI